MAARLPSCQARAEALLDQLSERHRWADRLAYAGPTTAARRIDAPVIIRMIGLMVMAALAIFVGADDLPISVGFFLLGYALTQPLLALIGPPSGTVRPVFAFLDIAAASVIIVLSPSLYSAGTIALVSVTALYAVSTSLGYYLALSTTAVGALIVLGFVTDTPFHERIWGMALLLACIHGVVGRGLRRGMHQTQRDFVQALEAAGAFAHVGDLETGHSLETLGDVERIVGWTSDEWARLDLRSILHPEDADTFWVEPQDLAGDAVIDRTARFRSASGEWIWLRDVSRVTFGPNGKMLRGIVMDVSAQQRGLDQMASQAVTDPLTGLANRRFLLEEMERRGDEVGHHLVLIDLNRFKDVNDALGHEAGDRLLLVVAERLVAVTPADHHLVRLGGDEFAILGPAGQSDDDITALVRRAAIVVAQPTEISGTSIATTLSAGIIRATVEHNDASTMLRCADMAMYEAKRLRRDWVMFDVELGLRHDRRLSLSSALPRAMFEGDVRLHFQPIVDTETAEITGVEGLARWHHPTFGLLEPHDFLDVVLMSERSGDFARSVVGQGMEMSARLAAIGSTTPVSVNVPVTVLEDAEFHVWFEDKCRQLDVSPASMVFEVAERDLHHAQRTVQAINKFVASGVGIAIDDFGTGHASFDRLRWRNVEQLKLDRSIVRGATEDDRDFCILRSITALAIELGYTLVAEGVETHAQVGMLRSMGCHWMQGYLISSPMPAADFVRLVAEHADDDQLQIETISRQ